MNHTPGIGKFCVILPEIWNFLASLGNKMFYIYLILSIIPGLKKHMMPEYFINEMHRQQGFLSEILVLIQLGIFLL
jgi:hypothetical protein